MNPDPGHALLPEMGSESQKGGHLRPHVWDGICCVGALLSVFPSHPGTHGPTCLCLPTRHAFIPQPKTVKPHRYFFSEKKAMKMRLCRYSPSTRIQ